MSVNFYTYFVYRDVCMLLLWNISAEQIPLEKFTVAQEFGSSNGTRILLTCSFGSDGFTCSQAEWIEFVYSPQLSVVWLVEYVALDYFLFLGALAKLRKATIIFVVSGRPSVRPHGITRLLLDGFSWNMIFGYFYKIFRKHSSLFQIWQEQRVL
jgi:hypothetical protein